jgi:glucosamine-6-phosphate deaminase
MILLTQVIILSNSGNLSAMENKNFNEWNLNIIGIGENGHLAFNDPPADFETE